MRLLVKNLTVISVAAFLVAMPMVACAQAAPAGKPLAFDAVSIRENTGPRAPGPPVYGATASGYRAVHVPMVIVLLDAYAPTDSNLQLFSPNSLVGMPEWFTHTAYDVDARVGEADMAEWQRPERKKAMLQAMLQQMFGERMKLAAHREKREQKVFEMRVSKAGKLTPSAGADLNKVRETYPRAGTLPGGIVMVENQGQVTIYGATMASLGALLENMVGRPVVDKTGLPGRFDITLRIDESAVTGEQSRQTMMVTALEEQLGLKLDAAKSEVEVLVIDHVEKPSEN